MQAAMPTPARESIMILDSLEIDIFKQQEMAKGRPQVTNELKKWWEWLINHVPESAGWEVSEEFETFHGRVISLYASYPSDTTTDHTYAPPPPLRDNGYTMHVPPRIDLIKNQTCIRSYEVTGPLNHNLILNTIHPVIKMQMRVVYSFSCTVYWGMESSCSVPQEVVSQWYLHKPKPD